MNDLEARILDAALRVFSLNGVKRTSMSDLCEEAGVSRQTLYNRFRNKDDILRGLIGHYTDIAIEEIAQAMPDRASLSEKLDLVFQCMVIDGYDTVQAMPHAQDFIDGVNAVSAEALEASASRFRAVIAEILTPHEAAFRRAGLSIDELSDFVQRAAKSAGIHARDRAHLIRQLRTLRLLCLGAASEDGPDKTPLKESRHAQGH
ncbi:TetR/AcrR family transcriptional regulator [Lutimaribacter marinistellae]|uniref:TetR/AcrR family transcriptional regulator n=1 Tax=Lutimaribacter marinistellae TaxID=1820329 RepID=A0ABV7TKS9_9RHOB